jgi:hypothetical protein
MTKEIMGVVRFWLVRTAEHIQTGKKVVDRFGPYATNKEAEKNRWEDEEARGMSEYEYAYHIETEII